MEKRDFEEIVEHSLIVGVRDLATGRIYPMVSGGEGDDEEDKEDTGKEPEAEDEDEKEDERAAKDAGAEDDDESSDEDQDAADSGAKDKGSVGLKKRLSKVSAKLRAYKAHGTPEDYAALKAEVAKYKKYEKEIEDEDRAKVDAEARAKGQPTVAEQNATFDRILERRFGPGAAQVFERFQENENREVARHVREGHEQLRGLLTEHSLEGQTKGEAFDEWDRLIGSNIRSNPERWAQFRNPITQAQAINDAFKEVKRNIVDPAVAASSAGKIKALQRRRAAAPTNGGASSAPEFKMRDLKPPKDLKGVERSRWWEKTLEEAASAIDAQDDA
jgi:hypothetical protein